MMNNSNYKIINNKAFFHHIKNGVEYTDPYICEWSEWKRLTERSIGTIKVQAGYIFKFWIYSLYFPAEKNESMLKYIVNYKRVIMDRGFQIEQELTTSSGGKFKQVIYEAKKTNSIINDLVALQSFFQFIYDHKTLSEHNDLPDLPKSNFYYDQLDIEGMKAKERHSKGHGYGLKAKGIMRESLMNRITVFTDLIKGAKKNSKRSSSISIDNLDSMPLGMYERLLEVAPPERKLLYLLCGAAPRIGQALHLTWFDVDQTNKRVFLVNPKSRNKEYPIDAKGYLFLDQPPRKKLLAEYGIDIELGHHKNIRWKTGEIPSVDDDEGFLHFIFDKWRDMFFETYLKVISNTPILHRKKNPFVFQTSTGKRLLPTEAYDGLQIDMTLVKKKYPEWSHSQIKGGFHLFRHMYGSIMSGCAYLGLAQDNSLNNIDVGGIKRMNIVQLTKVAVAKKMGHASGSSSADLYFKPDRYINIFVMDILKERMDEVRAANKKIVEAITKDA